jgi:hypothetical protein
MLVNSRRMPPGAQPGLGRVMPLSWVRCVNLSHCGGNGVAVSDKMACNLVSGFTNVTGNL